MAVTTRPCSARRRSWSRLEYATSWVSACRNVYSTLGKRLISYRNSPDWSSARLRRVASSDRSAISCSSASEHVLADHRGRLQQPLGLDGQAIDARGQHRLHGGGHLDLLDFPREAIVTAIARQHLGLGEGVHALFQEERIALGALDQELLERPQARVVAHQRPQQLLGALGRQRIDAELGVVALAGPAVLVFGPVAHQDERAGEREAVHQAVEERLALRIEPVQVLEDRDHRLHLALAQDQALHRVEHPLTALRQVGSLPFRVVHRHVQQLRGTRAGSAEGSRRGSGACR